MEKISLPVNSTNPTNPIAHPPTHEIKQSLDKITDYEYTIISNINTNIKQIKLLMALNKHNTKMIQMVKTNLSNV